MNIASLCRLPLFGLAVLLILSGCAGQRIGSPELAPSRYADRVAAELTPAEQRAFDTTGTLDRSLDPSMERMVRYHFVKYSRDRRTTMEAFLRNGLPYIDHVRQEFRSRGLPEDLAYLAYLESGYSPLAVSPSKATGIWQFIASTGKVYGLRQNWWIDERMDPYRSTRAAGDYLTRLHEIFRDWHLAIASYNGGEGAVGRAKKAAGARGLHDLIRKNEGLDPGVQLREETQLYVPRFLAISKIMRSADTLGLKPAAHDADHPVQVPTTALTAKPATDLVELARRLGMTWREFLLYNPHFLRSISPADSTANVYIPSHKAEKARELLGRKIAGSGWRYYTVRKGDTLASASKKTGVPASIIRQLNPVKIKSGVRLRVPAVAGSIPPEKPSVPQYQALPASSDKVTAALAELEDSSLNAAPSEYTVQSGDTLSSIAAKFGTTVRELQNINGGSATVKTLRAGQTIKLPVKAAAAGEVRTAPAPEVDFTPVVQRSHKVQRGDTLSGIAKKYGTTVREIEAANGGAAKVKTLRLGQMVKLPYTKEQLRRLEEQRVAKARREEEARRAEEARVKAELAKATHHTVQKGDTLSGIAKKYGVTVSEVQRANGGADKTKTLRIGQSIRLPRRGVSAEQPAPSISKVLTVRSSVPAVEARPAAKAVRPSEHEVQSGDTLSSIARKYGTTVRELQAANGGADRIKTLRVGQRIALPNAEGDIDSAASALAELRGAPKSATPVGVKAAAPAPKVRPAVQAGHPESYVVQSGDSIWAITHRFGMSEAEFKKLNPSVDSSSLRLGATVKIIRKK